MPSLRKIAEISLDGFYVVEDVCVRGEEVFVVGWRHNTSIQRSYMILAKLDRDGRIVWNVTWADYNSNGREISCNEYGLYVVCTSRNATNLLYYNLVKFSLNGKHEWNRSWSSIGGIYAAEEAVYIIKDGELTKLDVYGNILWENKVEGNAIDVANNCIYIAGSTTRSTGRHHAILTVFDMDGNQLWNASRTSMKGEGPIDVCAGVDGIYIVGVGTKVWNTLRFITKFSLDGKQIWDREWSAAEKNMTLYSLCKFQDSIYAVGIKGGSSDQVEAIIVYFDSEGNVSWQDVYTSSGVDYALEAHSTDERIYVVGYSERSVLPHWKGFLLIYSAI
ncbi:MAG: outer membrane protein assembly factor BamB family protein [Candidatus Bathyarchaeia archaeon]